LKNIFGNIQVEGTLSLTCFNFQDTRHWLPLISINDHEFIPLPTTADQVSNLNYTAPNQVYSLDLETEIEETLRTSLRSWRRVPTIFNSNWSDSLHRILHDLEDRKFNGIIMPASSSGYFELTEKLCRQGKQVFGFALHFSYFTADEIMERIKSTAIHQSKHPDVEFSIAVKVFPYACNLFSVWVCIITEMPPHQCFDL